MPRSVRREPDPLACAKVLPGKDVPPPPWSEQFPGEEQVLLWKYVDPAVSGRELEEADALAHAHLKTIVKGPQLRLGYWSRESANSVAGTGPIIRVFKYSVAPGGVANSRQRAG